MIQFITHANERYDYLDGVRMALEGGCRWIQLRMKDTFEDIKRINSAGADYIGCGPFRFTTTKKKLSPILELDGYKRIIEQMNAYRINLPVIAIGGILLPDVSDIMQTGVSGIAVSGAILNADNDNSPVATMKRFINELKSNNK